MKTRPSVRTPGWLRRASLIWRFALTSLVVFVVIGFGLTTVLGGFAQQSALSAAKAEAFDNLQFLHHLIHPEELQGQLVGRKFVKFDHLIRRDVLNSRVKVVKVWNPQGYVVYSTDPKIVGVRFPLEDDVKQALNGVPFSDVSNLSASEDADQRGFGQLLQVYIPIRFGHGPVVGAFEIYETYGPVASQINRLQTRTGLIVAAGLALLYFILFGVVRAGSKTISTQQKELKRHSAELEQSYADTIHSLAAAVDVRDAQTELHCERVTSLAMQLGEYVGLDPQSLRKLETGARLHDVGKIGVPDVILLKPGSLTDDEWELMRRHPVIGFDMIREVKSLRDALPVVRNHHERWDGAGYPDQLSGEDIPLAARIFSIVDTYDAITSDRPYRRGAPPAQALAAIEAEAGSQFDPVLAIAFVAMMSNARREAYTEQVRLVAAA